MNGHASQWFQRLIPLGFMVAGLLLFYHPQIFSGWRLMQPDPFDIRHIAYVLEHLYLWVLGSGFHSSYWDPPFFYPEPNVMAYSENLIGLSPLYMAWRLAGFLPDTSLQLLGITVGVLNFLTSYLFLKTLLNTGRVSTSMGAFLFSFASSRIIKVGHIQLVAQFFIMGALTALIRIFGEGEEKTKRTWVWVFWGCFAGQVYTGLYMAWLFTFGMAVTGIWILVLPSTRERFYENVAGLWKHWLAGGLLTAVAILPLVVHYREAAGQFGPRRFSVVWDMLPQLESWLNHGPRSWLYAWTYDLEVIRLLPFNYEHQLGFGVVTGLLVLYGLWNHRRQPYAQVLVLSTVTVFLLVTRWPGGFTLWQFVYDFVPGASSIRAIARFGLLFLVVAAIGFAIAWEQLWKRRPHTLVAALALFCVVEQGQSVATFPKQWLRGLHQTVAGHLPRDCDVFLYSPVLDREQSAHMRLWLNVDGHATAMWASLLANIPTVNGYSSNSPPQWPLQDVIIDHPDDEALIRERLKQWRSIKEIKNTTICWLKVSKSDPDEFSVEKLR